MLYYFLYSLHDKISAFNVFRYITVRSVLAVLTAFFISLLMGPWLIRKLREWKVGEHIRTEESVRLHELHRNKQDTPTMGGLLILSAVLLSTYLWADVGNKFIHMVTLSTVWLGVTGFIDDYLKQVKKRSKGLSARSKMASQIVLGAVLSFLMLSDPQINTSIDIPFVKHMMIDLDGFFLLFVVLVIAGTSNAVNLTDGLDGLAIGSVVMVALTFGILSYISGNVRLSDYLLVPFVKGGGELAIFCASIVGAGLGFLWFNCYPASVFMGDVGSLALGGALGTVALLIKKEILLILVGGIFVAEALSVILQVGSFKLTGKRIFKIAPLHHHFQFMNWPENKVIVRFWIVASLLALMTLVTLKVR